MYYNFPHNFIISRDHSQVDWASGAFEYFAEVPEKIYCLLTGDTFPQPWIYLCAKNIRSCLLTRNSLSRPDLFLRKFHAKSNLTREDNVISHVISLQLAFELPQEGKRRTCVHISDAEMDYWWEIPFSFA